MLDVPFSHGTLAINSERPDAFSEEDIETLGQFAGVLSEAYTRFEDIRRVGESAKALRESEERYRQFFENAPAYCYMVSPEGVILNVNGAVLKTLGYEREELVGKPLKKIYAPESLPKMKDLFAKWKKTGSLRDEEIVIITKDGNRRAVLLSADVVKDRDGKVLHSISVQRDITERKRAEEALQETEVKYRSLFENMLSGFAYCKILLSLAKICGKA